MKLASSLLLFTFDCWVVYSTRNMFTNPGLHFLRFTVYLYGIREILLTSTDNIFG